MQTMPIDIGMTSELATPSRLGAFSCPGGGKVVKVNRAKPGLPDAAVTYFSQ